MLWGSKMTTPSEMSKMNKLVGIIRKNGSINKIDLVITSGISISYYEKLKPYILHLFKDIEYDKNTKLWHAVKQVEIKEA